MKKVFYILLLMSTFILASCSTDDTSTLEAFDLSEIYYINVNPDFYSEAYYYTDDNARGYLSVLLDKFETETGVKILLRESYEHYSTDSYDDYQLRFGAVNILNDNISYTDEIQRKDYSVYGLDNLSDFSELENLNVGITTGDDILPFIQNNYPQLVDNLIAFPSHKEMIASLENGLIDYFISEELDYQNNVFTPEVSITNFNPSLRISSDISNSAVIIALDEMITRMKETGEFAELIRNEKAKFIYSQINFSYEELEYLNSLEDIRVVVDDNLYPYEYYANSKFDGFVTAFFQEISLVTDVEVKLITTLQNSSKTKKTLFESGVADVIFSNTEHEYQTMEILSSTISVVTNKDNNNLFTTSDFESEYVGIVNDNSFNKDVVAMFNPTIIEFDSYQKLLNAVKSEEVAYGIINNDIYESSLIRYGINNLVVVGSLSCLDSYHFAFNEEDYLMSSIIDKIVSYLDTEDILQYEQISVTQQFDLLLVIVPVVTTVIVSTIIYFFTRMYFAKKSAETAEKQKSNFLANISHEIRTPLNTIVGYTELMKSASLKDIVKYSEIVNDYSKYLSKLVDDVVDIQMLDLNIVKLDEKQFDLHNEIERMIEGYRHLAETKRIVIEDDLELPRNVIGDKLRICQIFTNLFVNAVKYTEKGIISVKARYEVSRNIKVIFEISDTGVGIPADKIENIFAPFEQVKSESNGNGLGLPIAKRFIEAMKGSISVISEVGTGSKFAFHIYLKKPEINVTKKIDRSFDTNTRILVVDDDRVSRILLKELLKTIGFFLVDISSGLDEALSYLARYKYDIVLLDLCMPDVDGEQVLKVIKQKYSRGVRFIAVSGDVMRHNNGSLLEKGFDDFISKPIDVDILNEKLKRKPH